MRILTTIVIGHNFCDANGGLGETSRRLYPGVTGTGASGARQVGRPRYLMSCELALLSGRPLRPARLRCERESVSVVLPAGSKTLI
jgi:hypothetical protein